MTQEEVNEIEEWKRKAELEGKSFHCKKIAAFLSYETCNYQRKHKSVPVCSICCGPKKKKQEQRILAVIKY